MTLSALTHEDGPRRLFCLLEERTFDLDAVYEFFHCENAGTLIEWLFPRGTLLEQCCESRLRSSSSCPPLVVRKLYLLAAQVLLTTSTCNAEYRPESKSG